MIDRVTANLPSRDFDQTVAFYGRLGFAVAYRDAGWLILARDTLMLEFFPHPELDPYASWFSACLRLDDPDKMLAEWQNLGLSSDHRAIPRLTGFVPASGGAPRMFALIDPDGSLLRVIDNQEA